MLRNALFPRLTPKDRRRLLLAGASAFALLFSCPGAQASKAVDALRAGGTVTATIQAAAAAAKNAAAVNQQTQASLAQAVQTLKAAQSAQAAARAAAQAAVSSVPDGLGTGGLNPGGGAAIAGAGVDLSGIDATKWQGVSSVSQSASGGQTTVDIQQGAQQALLTWQSFNVGKNTTVSFDQQGNTNWVAVNRVVDPTAAPSRILGAIKADGSVYVINQNGIIFGGTSQVNVHSLIASTADIAAPTTIYSALNGATYMPSFTGAGSGTGAYAGLVQVQSGALILTNAPASVTSGGGFVMLLGASVDNEGTIATPNGQTVLAAGNDFVIRTGYSTDSNTYSTTRGSEIAPGTWNAHSGTWTSGGGTVTNAGLIFAQEGDITLAGHTVAQNGVAIATTSVDVRGTIHLLNAASDITGSVTLGAGALTEILPELGTGETALNSKRDSLISDSATRDTNRANANYAVSQFDDLSALNDREDMGRIEIMTGGLVDFQSGSLTMAQGGQVAVSAGRRIFTAGGAVIDVSGTSSTLAMSANEIKVNIQGNELRDSPLNRDSGDLMNDNVWIDVRDLVLVPAGTGGYASDRYYTPGGLLEVSGYLSNQGHTIGEWTALGGIITLSAPEVVAQAGSVFNISGGSVTYQPGMVTLTNLLGADGRTYTVENAPAGMLFIGLGDEIVVEHKMWGVTETYHRAFGLGLETTWDDSGYTVGRDAGQLIISAAAPTSVFEGSIVADAYNGQRQSATRPSGVTDGYKYTQTTVAMAGSLELGDFVPLANSSNPSDAAAADVKIGDFADITEGMSATDALPATRAGTAWFDAAILNGAHLGGFSVISQERIDITSALTLGTGGTLNLVAPVIDVEANLVARGGSVTLTNVIDSPSVANNLSILSPANGRPTITVGPDATIDTRGLWTNYLTDPGTDPSLSAFVNGGDVTIRCTGDVVFDTGALIDASSGAAVLATGATKGGQGGNITLSASYDSNASNPASNLGVAVNDHGDLTFDGTVLSYGVTKGGGLTLETGGALVIGGVGYSQGDTLPAGTAAPYGLILTSSLTIPAGTVLPATVTFSRLPPGAALPSSLWVLPSYSSPGFIYSGMTQAAWTNIPTDMRYQTSSGTVSIPKGGTVPAGATIIYIDITGLNPATPFIIPADVYPQGIALYSGSTVTYFAGSTVPFNLTYVPGTVIPKGTVLGQNISVEPVLSSTLGTDLFNSGFSSYTINGANGLTVAPGTAIVATMPVYRFTKASFTAPTGTDPAAALQVWTPPLYAEDPLKATLTPRAGADVTLMAASTAGSLTIGPDASVTVDPGRSITLASGGSVDVEGSLTAHGGTISLLQVYLAAPLAAKPWAIVSDYGAAGSLWVGDSGVLDVSAVAVTAVDADGRTYGIVPDGGTIKFGRAVSDSAYASVGVASAADDYIVILPGAVLDASGTRATIDLDAGATLPGSRPVSLASNGGGITLDSYDGILTEGTLLAKAGGAGAAGGTLHVMLETPYYDMDPNIAHIVSTPAAYQAGRVLTVGQSVVPGALPAGSDPSTAVPTPGQGGIAADAIAAGGFDTVYLGSRDAIAFDGNVFLTAGSGITLHTAALYDTAATGTVAVTAPYVFLDGASMVKVPSADKAMPASLLPSSLTAITGTRFGIDADLIDVRNAVISTFADTSLTSATDLRFLAGTVPAGSSHTPTTVLAAPNGNMELTAEQVYPASGAVAIVAAGYRYDYTVDNFPWTNAPRAPGATLTIASVDGVSPDLPYSVFGSLTLQAPMVRQGGIVRAPLGSITLGFINTNLVAGPDISVELLPGSITSVSAAGLTMPYGGTTDGVTYTADGATAMTVDLLKGQYTINGIAYTQGITLNGAWVSGDAGAILDVSGGGTLTGAGFISGRGGSVDVLTAPLIKSNPANTYSGTSDQVYAIVPGVVTAPAAGGYYAAWSGSVPAVGRQITIPAGVPGLPAGTYTLLPANYALLPGAFRVELGTTSAAVAQSFIGATADGTTLATGYLGVANTAIRNVLPTEVIIMPGTTVRTRSDYDEENYSDFELSQVVTFGRLRPLLPMDGKFLTIDLRPTTVASSHTDALVFKGSADFAADPGHPDAYDGSLIVASAVLADTQGNDIKNILQITADNSATPRTPTVSTVTASTIDAFDAANVFLEAQYYSGLASGVTVESGTVLRGAQVSLQGATVTLEAGAVIDTLGWGVHAPDSSIGYIVSPIDGRAVVLVANGQYLLDASKTNGTVTVGDGVSLLTDGTVGFITQNGGFQGSVKIAALELGLAMPTINIGSAEALDAAGISGFRLDQAFLDMLLTGSAAGGGHGIQNLSLTAAYSINFYGTSTLDFTGLGSGSGQLALTAPALYGAGGPADTATIEVDTLVWNGYLTRTQANSVVTWGSRAPGPITPAGAGYGSGAFVVDAKDIVLGYPADSILANTTTTLDRLMLGFSTVTLDASEKITAGNEGTLSVYQSTTVDLSQGFTPKTFTGSGGILNLVTPLLTGDAGAVLKIYAGGNITVAVPAGAAPATATPSALGAEIDIVSAGAVTLDTAVWLPTGKFDVTAAGDIALGAHSRLDLAGQAVPMFDVTEYTWGGDVGLESTSGNIAQDPGSVIDISAVGNDAGTLTLTATGAGAGKVTLAGTLNAASVAVDGASHEGGSFDLRAQKIDDDPANTLSGDFATLNNTLDRAGFTESRSFDLKQGSLTIASGQTVTAHEVSISIDGGSLIVNGTIDASGTGVGSITLAAMSDLTINGTLDAHATRLKTDSHGVAIAADNVADIEVTSRNGTLTLAPGAVLDLSTPDGVAYGKVILNAPRTGETSGDIEVAAPSGLTIRGARSIALNAFWTYSLADGSTITQATLDGYDAASQSFMTDAYSGTALNSGLQAKLAGLLTYGDAFHLRPGVEIDGTGDLTVSGDIDLAGYRYGPNADRVTTSATYGAGEPMALVIRAAGDLTVTGSISDGFAIVAATASSYGGIIQDITADGSGFTFRIADDGNNDKYYIYNSTTQYLYITQTWTIPDDTFQNWWFNYQDPNFITPGGYGGFYQSNLNVYYDPIPNDPYASNVIQAGTQLLASSIAVSSGEIQSGLVPPGLFAATMTPAGNPAPATSAAALPLASGTSASLRLVSGADLSAASTKVLTARSALAGSGNLVLDNPKVSTATLLGEAIPEASVLRVGTGDLDLLAGGNFSEDSLYNISTNASEPAPGDLTVKVQGDLTGQIRYDYIMANYYANTATAYSSSISNWLNGNQGTTAYFDGFTGFGALGGGKVTIQVGGDAGELTVPSYFNHCTSVGCNSHNVIESTGLVVAATSGDVTVKIGGRLNPQTQVLTSIQDDDNGVFTALRGDLSIKAGAIGVLPLIYGINETNDPRGVDYASAAMASPLGAITVVAGDGATSLLTRGDLALGGIGAQATIADWTDRTSISLVSAGGNVMPLDSSGGPNTATIALMGGSQTILPSVFSVVAASGSIYYGNTGNTDDTVVLMAEPSGSLELLAMGSIYGAGLSNQSGYAYSADRWVLLSNPTLTLYDGDTDPIRVYAVNGDLVNVDLGEVFTYNNTTTDYGAKAAWVKAGGDIVTFGESGNPSLILNTHADDISVIQAGGDIYYANVDIGGPGTLEVTAGGTLYQGNAGSITSVGPLATGDTQSGASIIVAAGVGAKGPDYAALYQYLDPANLAVSGIPLADQPGKVAETYQDELETWLKSYKGYAAASVADALAYFEALPMDQQEIFLLDKVYFPELKASGREETDPDSRRYKSYLRGRDAIAALFPADRGYAGDLVMYGNSGIRTLYGGDLSILTPGGGQIIGVEVEGLPPGPQAGLITQGQGDISLYSEGSILLGLSRIMTTFGGDILAWSATGDINAGRGAKTTVIYTPPKVVYDLYGNVALSPEAPSTGAGIAALDPIPEVPAGDVDLIAPLGTVDAGEAGIRVSGNLNIAALRITNAANIQVQGTVSGIPVAAVPPNIGAMTAASNTAGAAAAAAENAARTSRQTGPRASTLPSIITVEVIGYGGASEGDVEDPQRQEAKRRHR